MKNIRLFGSVLLAALILLGCSGNKTGQPSTEDLWVSWNLISNPSEKGDTVRSAFTIVNKSKEDMGKDWVLYFNFGRIPKIDALNPVTGNVTLSHVNGDLFKIVPSDSFKLAAGDSVKIEFTANNWLINFTDAPAGLYIVYNDKDGKETQPQVISHYTVLPFPTAPQKRSKLDNIVTPTAATRYADNSYLTNLSQEEILPIIPAPVDYKYGKATIAIGSDYSIVAPAELNNESAFLEKSLNKLLTSPLSKSGNKKIELILKDAKNVDVRTTHNGEGYSLVVKADGNISITSYGSAGVFYGIQSLLALLPVEAWKQPATTLSVREITVTDYPRFTYRGMSMDVARNFQKKQAVLKLLDEMAFYKLNTFHFHLSDDEGWRVEIPGLPELTEVGSNRKHDASGKGVIPSFGSGPFADTENSHGSGYYTRADFIEILKYAKERHITVIPEIDMPGHIRAAIKAMDARYEKYMKDGNKAEAEKYLLRDLNDSSKYMSVQMWTDNTLCPCQESTYNFVDKIITEFQVMYKEAGAPLNTFHMGGDEVTSHVWEKSPLCANLIGKTEGVEVAHDLYYYYVDRVNKIIAKHGLTTSGWEEIGLMQEKSVDKDGKEVVHHVPNPAQANTGMTLYYWNSVPGWGTEDHAYQLANAGYKVVLANVNYLYFDLAYSKDPEEVGYYWGGFVDLRKPFEFIPLNSYRSTDYDTNGNPIDKKAMFGSKVQLNPSAQKNIIGIQGNVWAENDKGQATMEYLVFPRLMMLAQRAWSPDPAWAQQADDNKRIQGLQADWNVFVNTLGQRELPRQDYMFGGLGYMVPQPGAIIENGTLKANVVFPGLTIRYTTDGSEPTEKSPVYTEPVAVTSKTVKLKSFTTNGRSSRVSIVQ